MHKSTGSVIRKSRRHLQLVLPPSDPDIDDNDASHETPRDANGTNNQCEITARQSIAASRGAVFQTRVGRVANQYRALQREVAEITDRPSLHPAITVRLR